MEHLSQRILWQKLKRLSFPAPRILIELKKHSVVTSILRISHLILYKIVSISIIIDISTLL